MKNYGETRTEIRYHKLVIYKWVFMKWIADTIIEIPAKMTNTRQDVFFIDKTTPVRGISIT